MPVPAKPDRDALFRSLATSLGVCIPAFCLAVFLMESRIAWGAPGTVTAGILGLAAFNFLLTVALEYHRARIGALTLPALLSGIGIVLLCVFAEAVGRYYVDVGYGWLLPLTVMFMGFSAAAIFRERMVVLKCYLALNTVVLAALFGLGAAGKVAMPF